MSTNIVPTIGVIDGHRADTRRTDPTTSHEARDNITLEALAESQAEVLAILHIYGPVTAADLVDYHELRYAMGHANGHLSDSRLRTALNELKDAGRAEVYDTVRRVSRAGGRATAQRRWVVTP